MLRDIFSDPKEVPVSYKKRTWQDFYNSFNVVEKATADGLLYVLDLKKEALERSNSPYNDISQYIELYTDKVCKPYNETKNVIDVLEQEIQTFLNQKYPDLISRFVSRPADVEAFQKELEQVKNDMVSHPLYNDYKLLVDRDEGKSDLYSDCDRFTRKKTRYERLKYLLDTKILEEYLYKKDEKGELDPVYKWKYEQLKRCEVQPFFI